MQPPAEPNLQVSAPPACSKDCIAQWSPEDLPSHCSTQGGASAPPGAVQVSAKPRDREETTNGSSCSKFGASRGSVLTQSCRSAGRAGASHSKASWQPLNLKAPEFDTRPRNAWLATPLLHLACSLARGKEESPEEEKSRIKAAAVQPPAAGSPAPGDAQSGSGPVPDHHPAAGEGSKQHPPAPGRLCGKPKLASPHPWPR